MARTLVTIDVPGDPKDVFDYLADFSNTAEWDPSVVAAERLDTGKVGLASRFHVVVALFGARSELTYRLTAYERPWRFRLEGGNGIVTSEDDIAITPVAGGVRVTYDANLRLPLLLRPLDPLVQMAVQWASGATVASLREVLRARSRTRSRKQTPP